VWVGAANIAQGGALVISGENTCPASVLIVDSSGETSEVLRTVLERKGLRILAATEADEGLALLREHQPSVTVLDLESERATDTSLCRAYDDETEANLVVLGRLPRESVALARHRVVAKPYHYAPLIRTIESLVEQVHTRAG